MERFDCNLWEYFKEPSQQQYNVTFDQRISILEKLFETTLFIQTSGYCHLDLKPSNIFLKLTNGTTWDGVTLKIGDFGLSRKSDDLIGSMGTPGFGSPEQFEGRPSMKSDNFALGRMAIIVLNPWKAAWNMMAQPITDAVYNAHPARQIEVFQIISSLLNVSY